MKNIIFNVTKVPSNEEFYMLIPKELKDKIALEDEDYLFISETGIISCSVQVKFCDTPDITIPKKLYNLLKWEESFDEEEYPSTDSADFSLISEKSGKASIWTDLYAKMKNLNIDNLKLENHYGFKIYDPDEIDQESNFFEFSNYKNQIRGLNKIKKYRTADKIAKYYIAGGTISAGILGQWALALLNLNKYEDALKVAEIVYESLQKQYPNKDKDLEHMAEEVIATCIDNKISFENIKFLNSKIEEFKKQVETADMEIEFGRAIRKGDLLQIQTLFSEGMAPKSKRVVLEENIFNRFESLNKKWENYREYAEYHSCDFQVAYKNGMDTFKMLVLHPEGKKEIFSNSIVSEIISRKDIETINFLTEINRKAMENRVESTRIPNDFFLVSSLLDLGFAPENIFSLNHRDNVKIMELFSKTGFHENNKKFLEVVSELEEEDSML